MDHKKRKKKQPFCRNFVKKAFSSIDLFKFVSTFNSFHFSAMKWLNIYPWYKPYFLCFKVFMGFYHQHTQKLFVKMKTNFQPGMKLVCNLKHAGH